MYSTNIGGMRGMASGGMQVPHMSMMNGIGGNGMMNGMWGNGMMNGMGENGMMNGMGGNCGFNSYQGMANQMYGGGMRKFALIHIFQS